VREKRERKKKSERKRERERWYSPNKWKKSTVKKRKYTLHIHKITSKQTSRWKCHATFFSFGSLSEEEEKSFYKEKMFPVWKIFFRPYFPMKFQGPQKCVSVQPTQAAKTGCPIIRIWCKQKAKFSQMDRLGKKSLPVFPLFLTTNGRPPSNDKKLLLLEKHTDIFQSKKVYI